MYVDLLKTLFEKHQIKVHIWREILERDSQKLSNTSKVNDKRNQDLCKNVAVHTHFQTGMYVLQKQGKKTRRSTAHKSCTYTTT